MNKQVNLNKSLFKNYSHYRVLNSMRFIVYLQYFRQLYKTILPGYTVALSTYPTYITLGQKCIAKKCTQTTNLDKWHDPYALKTIANNHQTKLVVYLCRKTIVEMLKKVDSDATIEVRLYSSIVESDLEMDLVEDNRALLLYSVFCSFSPRTMALSCRCVGAPSQAQESYAGFLEGRQWGGHPEVSVVYLCDRVGVCGWGWAARCALCQGTSGTPPLVYYRLVTPLQT